MSNSFKAYLHASDGSVEVRRFGVVKEQLTNFAALAAKLANIFPALSRKEFTVYYHDDENEKVVIGSDEELEIALHVTVSKDPYRIHIETVGKLPQDNGSIPKAAEGELHAHVTCDGCDGPVRGFRYKCMECPDYDLCAKCEMKSFHPGHKMMRIPIPSMMPPYCPYMKRQGASFPPFGGRCGRFSRPCRMEPDTTAEQPEEKKVPCDEQMNGMFKPGASAEYLKSIGSMLDIFGVDVEVDAIPPENGGSVEANEAPAAQQPEVQNQVPMNEDKKPSPDREVPNVFAPGLFGWTLVNGLAAAAGKAAAAGNGEPSVEEKVALALKRMCEMGFNNEGNWLGQLLTMKNGSIDAVLEILNPRK